MSDAEIVHLKKLEDLARGSGLEAVEKWIEDGKVTFFVGSAVSARGVDADSSSIGAIQRLKLAAQRLKTHFKDQPAELAFVKEFERHYTPEGNVPPPDAGAETPRVASAKLEKLRQSLVVLVTAMTRTFNSVMSPSFDEAASSLPGQQHHFTGRQTQILLDSSHPKHKAVFDALATVLDAACVLDVHDTDTPWGKVMIRNLHPELCAWIALHVSRSEWKKRWNKKQHADTFERVAGKVASIFEHRVGDTPITQADLEWFSDILWLTMRLNLPFYPTSHELAIEIGVASETLFPPTPILAKSAEAVSTYDEVEDYIQKRFRIEPPPPLSKSKAKHRIVRETDAHHVLAATLVGMAVANKPASAKTNDRKSLFKARRAASGPPVLLTTNFDMGIEQALVRILREHEECSEPEFKPNCFRTMFPILVSASGSGQRDRYVIRWVIRKSTPAAGSNEYSIIEPTETSKPDSDPGDEARKVGKVTILPDTWKLIDGRWDDGPLIVKLHGSPLEPLDADALNEYFDSQERRHYIIASEYHYVSALIRRTYSRLPCLEQLFTLKDRHLVFMGYSLADWNIRVALAHHANTALQVSMGREHGKGDDLDDLAAAPSRLAIVKDRALGDVALFHRLGVSTSRFDIHAALANIARRVSIRDYLLPEIRNHFLPGSGSGGAASDESGT